MLPQQPQQIAGVVVALGALPSRGKVLRSFVKDQRLAEDAELEAGFLGSQAEVGLLMNEEELLVDEADFLDDVAADHQAAAVDDVHIDDTGRPSSGTGTRWKKPGSLRLVEGDAFGLHLVRRLHEADDRAEDAVGGCPPPRRAGVRRSRGSTVVSLLSRMTRSAPRSRASFRPRLLPPAQPPLTAERTNRTPGKSAFQRVFDVYLRGVVDDDDDRAAGLRSEARQRRVSARPL